MPLETYANTTPPLKNIAEATVKKYDNGELKTYKNIDEFIKKVYSTNNNVDKLELAKFIMDYTNQEYDSLPEEIILECLDFKEISYSEDYLKVNENNDIEYLSENEMKNQLAIEELKSTNSPKKATSSSWTSSNGYMKITTSYSLRKTSGNRKYYTISSTAKWLKLPICYFQDVFTIGNSATFDSSYEEYGYLQENLECCTHTYTYKNSAKKNANGSNVKFDYSGGVNNAAIRFKLQSALLYTCPELKNNHMHSINSITAYIRYGIIVNKGTSANIQGAYCHKQISASSIGISASGDGSISFSLSVAGKKNDYKARPITINA